MTLSNSSLTPSLLLTLLGCAVIHRVAEGGREGGGEGGREGGSTITNLFFFYFFLFPPHVNRVCCHPSCGRSSRRA